MQTSLYREQFLRAVGKSGFGPPVVYQPIKLQTFSFFLIAVSALLVAVVVWVPLNDIESVNGQLELQGGSAAVISPRRGVLTELLVANGQFVRKGDVLARASSTEYDQFGGSSVGSQLTVLDQQLSTMAQRRSLVHLSETSQSALNENMIVILERELEALLAQKNVYEEKLSLAVNNLSRDEDLLVRDMLPLTSVERSSDAVMSAKILLKDIELKIYAQRKSLLDMRAMLELYPIQHQQELLEIRNEELRLQSLKQELMVQSSFSLTAQREGFIDNLFFKVGDQLDSRNPVMHIVSPANAFGAKLYVPSRGVADLKIGQLVRVSIEALPSEKYGYFSGVIETISQESVQITDNTHGLSKSEDVYVLGVALSREQFSSSVFNSLRSGMGLRAEIVTGKRTILDRLLKPIQSLGGRL